MGDGNIVPSPLYRPVIPVLGRRAQPGHTVDRPKRKPPRNPLKLLQNFDILLLLLLNAIACAIYYGFITTISTLFSGAYPFLNEQKIGLCFLAIGGGMSLGSWINGQYLDWEYKRVSQRLADRARRIEEKEERRLPSAARDTVLGDVDFPIEKVE